MVETVDRRLPEGGEGRVLPWTLVVILALVLGVALISRSSLGAQLSSARDQLEAVHGRLSAEQARNGNLTGNVVHLRSQTQHWRGTSHHFQAQVKALQDRISQSLGDLDHPTFSLWNSCGKGGPKAGCVLKPGQEYIGGLPDTFTYELKFRATVPVTVHVLSVKDFVCYETRRCSWQGQTWENQRKLDEFLHQAEGCAGYFTVFTSEQSGRLYPDIWVTRNPASLPTGTCA
jgi:hypothetical protein